MTPLGKIVRIPALVLSTLLVFPVAVRALDWDKTEIKEHADFGKQLAPYVFTCINSGTASVAITDVQASCGCLVASLDKRILAPGENAKVTVQFRREGYAGEIERSITVTTDERDKQPYHLLLHADLFEPLTLAPRLLYWEKKDAVKTKSADVKVNMPQGVEIPSVACTCDDFDVTLVTLEAGRHYRLDITPHSTDAPSIMVVTLQPATPLPDGTALTVFAQVR